MPRKAFLADLEKIQRPGEVDRRISGRFLQFFILFHTHSEISISMVGALYRLPELPSE